MRHKRHNGKWHIKQRIFMMLLLLMAVVFTSVFFSFNAFISRYIRSNVEAQLDDLVNSEGGRYDKPPDKPQSDNFLPDLSKQPKNKIGARGEVLIVDAEYNLKVYNPDEDINELTQITAYLRSKNIPLETARYAAVSTEQNQYYISSLEDRVRPGSFFVYYVSVSAIGHLLKTINWAMLVIVAAAMVICFIIANIIAGSVTSPVKKLRAFAGDIGKGHFERKTFSFRDIEFDELGEAMNQSAEKLDLYDKDQRAFFQNVSHELRTPLMSIRCYAEGVEHGLVDPKKSGATIISEADRLSEMVEDLLYLSRVDSITEQFEKHENDLRETLSICAERLKSVADKNGIRMAYLFDDEPVWFIYNEKHMGRAFTNLISNALRYAKTTITLCCRRDGSKVIVSVIDDGDGVTPEDRAHIFERFYKGKGGKHGIGLSIVKSVVALHRGDITVSCDQDTCFTIVFYP